MNKKMIALAVAAAMPMAAANAGVTVYGIAQLEVGSIDGGTSSSNQMVDSKNSRLGVKWSEDLGNGMSAVGEMEFGPDLLDSANKTTCSTDAITISASPASCSVGGASKSGIYARQANVGLKGGFGEIRLGTNKQPYKYSGGVKYDAFVATAAEARSGNGGMIKSHFGQGGYFAESISWKKKFDAVTVWLATSFSEADDTNNVYKGADGDINAAITFGAKNFEVGYAMAEDNCTSGTGDYTATACVDGESNSKIFGKFKTGPHTILAQLESSDAPNNGPTTDYQFLGYRFQMGKNTFVVQLGKTDPDAGTKTDYTAFGIVHAMSKKTRVFLANRKTDPEGGNDTGGTVVGITTKF